MITINIRIFILLIERNIYVFRYFISYYIELFTLYFIHYTDWGYGFSTKRGKPCRTAGVTLRNLMVRKEYDHLYILDISYKLLISVSVLVNQESDSYANRTTKQRQKEVKLQ